MRFFEVPTRVSKFPTEVFIFRSFKLRTVKFKAGCAPMWSGADPIKKFQLKI